MKPSKTIITSESVAAVAASIFSRPTAPFHEDAVVGEVASFAMKRPWLVLESDADGNLHLHRKEVRKKTDPIIFSAHMDHPGFVVRACTAGKRGFLVSAEFRGGVEDRFFPGARARFFPAEIPARVVSVQKDPKSGEKIVSLSSAAPIARGSFGMWELPPFRHDKKKDLLISRVVDDLAGVAAALVLLDALPRLDPKGRADIRAVFTRGEEVGFWGAAGAARAGRFPGKARMISLEASKTLSHAPLGGGPILRTGDRASVFNDQITRSLAGTAAALAKEDPSFKWQRKLMDGGTCEGTAYQAYGYRTGALCVPLLNYHNMGADGRIRAEAVRLSDLTGMVRWMAAWALSPAVPPPIKPRIESTYSAWKKKIPAQ